MFRIEFNGAIVVGDGAVHAKNGELRSEFNGAVVVGDGAVVIALAFFGKATVVVLRRERGSLSCGDSRKHQT